MESDEQRKELRCCYSVGSFGPFPISFYSIKDEFYYDPQEHGERGPFKSLKIALEDAERDFWGGDGGFHESLEDAEQHADWMREQGFGVE